MTDTTIQHTSPSTNSVQDTSSGQNFSKWSQTIDSYTSNQDTSSKEPSADTNSPSVWPTINMEQLTPDVYMPSELERKRAVVMYFLVGIVITLQSNSPISDYERFHLQQSLGRRAIFSVLVFVLILYIVIFLFVFWFMMFFPALITLLYLSLWGYFVYQAWKGKDVTNTNADNKIFMPMFSDLWSRLLGIFEITKR